MFELIYTPYGALVSVLVLVLEIYTLYLLWARDRHRESNKLLWTLMILIFPVVGMLLYYMVGRKGSLNRGSAL